MNSLARALRFAWPYRGRFLLSCACALMVGAFWGASLGAVYPVVELLFHNRNLHQWIDDKIAEAEQAAGGQNAILADPAPLSEQDDSHLIARGEPLAPLPAISQRKLDWYKKLRPLIAQFAPTSPFQTLLLVVGLVMVGIVAKGIFSFLQLVLVGSVVHRSMLDLRRHFFDQTLRMDLAHFTNDGTNELMARFTQDAKALSVGMLTLLAKTLRELLKAAACLVGACAVNWKLTALVVLLAPLAVLALARIGRLMKRASRRSLESMTRIYKILEESFQGIKVVKAFTMEEYEQTRFSREAENYFRKSMRLVRFDAMASPVMEVIGFGAWVTALMAGAYLTMTGSTHLFGVRMFDRPLEPASLALLYALLAGISDPARKLSSVYTDIQRGAAAADRIFAYLDRQPQIVSPPRAGSVPRHGRLVELDCVSFAYEAGQPVLRDVSLEIPFGSCIALVGPNGCGKSTLANLIPRFYDPQRGAVRLDGVDLRELSVPGLRRQIGIVTQETILFDDTVANNIAYGKPDVSQQDIEKAARRAHAHRFIEKLPQGYDTTIGEGGALLSGGQRQRIALARAILRDPAILILDEATSALDLESEYLIHEALAEFVRGRTTLLITHRLGTLALAQQVVVLDAGRILAVGTHAELMRECQLYGRLHEIHFQKQSA